MKTFKTIGELCDYVPNCIICGKEMGLTLVGRMAQKLPAKNAYDSGRSFRAKLEVKDGIARSKNPNLNVSIRIEDNFVVSGLDQVNKMLISWTYMHKMCHTCNFKIETFYASGNTKKENCFPPLTLRHEELRYTYKGGKDLHVNKYYNDQDDLTKASVRFNGKYLPAVPLEFNKIQDLEQLNKKLSMIIVFH